MKLKNLEEGDEFVFNDRVEPYTVIDNTPYAKFSPHVTCESPKGIIYEIHYGTTEGTDGHMSHKDGGYQTGISVEDIEIVNDDNE